MNRWENRVAVVTGASSGIGAAIVIDLIKAKMIVVGLARRLDRMEKLREELPTDLKSNFHYLKCDVSNEENVKNCFQWINENLGGTDVLVNNAGCLKYGTLSNDLTSDEIRNCLNTNVMGIVYCTKEAFKSMKERDFNGHVILINSLSGQMPINLPGISLNIYAPTKYAVTALTETYRQEFRDLKTKIKITSISPAGTDTEIIPEEWKKHGDLNDLLRPSDIAEAVLYTLGTGPNCQVHEITIKPLGSAC
ncbi:farnesol dehydrogenase-like [Condylostylus longicornis]|uniref:farnesol dehydrogenase-like n=1 Tax=Condylostylus longicornis TaxID=2530218 RepID=UPI00244DD37C|nr:farnesol dehydrogenase-like [Condylostylus longicornis]